MTQLQTQTKQKLSKTDVVLHDILHEVRSLRREIAFVISHENVDDYAHASRVKRSYAKALKQHPLSDV